MDAQTGMRIAACANRIAAWLGVRDLTDLSKESLAREACVTDGVVDLFVLFGGGVLGSVDVMANAIKRGVAHKYAVVGGRGHATYGLSNAVEKLLVEMDVAGKELPEYVPDPQTASEAEMIAAVLDLRYGLALDLLETRSTNCGNNIEYLFDLLDEAADVPKSVILCQDATMQRRMDATWRRRVEDRKRFACTCVINWAAYRVELVWQEDGLKYVNEPEGMWDTGRYISLLLGDVARLIDDERGYGPRGADFVVHVDVPADVLEAWRELRELCPDDQRLL